MSSADSQARDQVEVTGRDVEVEIKEQKVEDKTDYARPPSIRRNESSEQNDNSESDSNQGDSLEWDFHMNPFDHTQARAMMLDIRREEDGMLRNVSCEVYGSEAISTAFLMPRDKNVLLRVFHVQNLTSPRVLQKILSKYDIVLGSMGSSREIVKNFENWVIQRQPRRLAGKPLFHARAWKQFTDHVRGISRVTFGFDYMKLYDIAEYEQELSEAREQLRTFQLKGYDADENPIPICDIFPQKVSVLIQRRTREHRKAPVTDKEKEKAADSFLDNGNAIIIFDNANTLNSKDTLIPARGSIERQWRKMPFRYNQSPTDWNDDKVVLSCLKSILNYVYYKNIEVWDEILDRSWEHINILEDQIYDQPADESRAPELWNSSALWLKYDKLLYFHKECFLDAQKALKATIFKDEFANFIPFANCESEYTRLSNILNDDMIKPTANLSDLMYKSVGIRDSRHSLRLGNSMWRLSWITFVFLPLTFIVGFFGMNVNIFENNPDIKWYFIACVPFMVLVLALWFVLKLWFTRRERREYEREAFRTLISTLHVENSNLWSRSGPMGSVEPVDFMSRMKWKLIKYWMREFSEEEEENRRASTNTWGDYEAQRKTNRLGFMGRVKASLMKKWSKEIRLMGPETISLMETEIPGGDNITEHPEVTPPKRSSTLRAHEFSPEAPHGRAINVSVDLNTNSRGV